VCLALPIIERLDQSEELDRRKTGAACEHRNPKSAICIALIYVSCNLEPRPKVGLLSRACALRPGTIPKARSRA
jgi:hypothetical protein